MGRYPNPGDLPMAVVASEKDDLVFVQSRETVAPAWWAVEWDGCGWKCGCEGYRRRHRCAHVNAVTARERRLAPVPSDPEAGTPDWWAQKEAGFYSPGGAG